jgi:hypothetical protein
VIEEKRVKWFGHAFRMTWEREVEKVVGRKNQRKTIKD